MTPSEIETYHGNETQVALEIHHFDEQTPPTYWLRSGVAAFQASELELRELIDLLTSYKEEELDFALPKNRVKQVIALAMLTLVVGLLIGVGFYV